MSSSLRPVPAIALIAAVAAVSAGARADAESAAGPPSRPASLRVLLVGNSYSKFNGLPEVLERVAGSVAGGPEVRADITFRAGVGLRTHWARGHARRMIRRGDYTHVVLQGHSRAVFDGPEELIRYARRFGREIEEAGATPVLMATWARHPSSSLYALGEDARTPIEMQTRIDALYARAAAEAGAAVAPVGDAWLVSVARWPHLRLHRPDASHPTHRGTYLTASVLYGVLTGRDPREIGYGIPGADPTVLTRLQAVAAEAVRAHAALEDRPVAEAGPAGELDRPTTAAGPPREDARALDTP
ncbi:MAG: hypothetical protein ACOC97_02450 [Myxococcota bacterium]